jgi:oligopeptide/dipeptide ABC transporter ATP-binding protein
MSASSEPDGGSGLPAGSILRIENLKTHFFSGDTVVKSVDGVNLEIRRGQTLAVVGESGSGKSVTSLSIMRLIAAPPGRIVDGKILFRDRAGATHDLVRLPMAAMRRIRGREISMIFQEPMSSLNPLYTVGDQIAETLMLHEGKSRRSALEEARRMLEMVEIPAAAKRLHDYPHQLSGGMRQRVMIAQALACRPALLIADEPTTALDVTVQAQILNLMCKLQQELGMSILFITHNLGVVAEIAHEVAVMYAGRVVEQADVESLFAQPRHPYTQALLTCVPRLDQRPDRNRPAQRLPSIPGTIPQPTALPPGCAFAPRCWRADAACSAALPPLIQIGATHSSRCLHWDSKIGAPA